MRKNLPLRGLLGLLALLTLIPPAAAQNCSVDFEQLPFGPVLLGEQRMRVLTVTNLGAEPLPLDLLAQPCPEDPAFIVLTDGHFDVAPGASQVIQIRFAPESPGSHACSLDLGSNDCPPVQLTGWGHEYSEPVGNHIGLYRDTEAQICQAPLDGPSQVVQMRVLAVLPDLPDGGITAAEFRLANLPENNFPPAGHWEATWHTNLVIGSPETGVALAFYPPLVGSIVELGYLVFTSYEQTDWIGADHVVQVAPSINGNALVVVDLDYHEVPVGGGDFTFNCSDPPNCPCTGNFEPLCVVQPGSLDFGIVDVGTSVLRSFTIWNQGDGPLTGVVSEDCPDFDITTGGGFFSLLMGEYRTVQIRFTPSEAGEQTCLVELGTTQCPEVVCTGTGWIPVPICQATPSTLSFDDLVVGESQDLSFQLRNAGAGVLEGEVSEQCEEFELLAGAGPYALGAGQAITVTLRFAPTIPGEQYCTVELGSDYCDPVEASGSAHDPVPDCSLEPEALDFGDLALGSSLDLDAVVHNTGDIALNGELALDDPHFSLVDGEGPFTVAPGMDWEFTVRYAPQEPGPHAAILSTGLPYCAELPLAGMAHEPAPLCVLEPEALDFGELLLGNAAQDGFQLRNEGDAPLQGDITLDSEHFQLLAGGGPFSLDPGGVLPVSLRYLPLGYGPHSATVDLGSEACADLPLSGFARNPAQGGDHIGLFLDEEGTLCSGDLPAYTHTSLFLVAQVPSFATPGITGAEFRLEGLAEIADDIELQIDWLLPPLDGDLVTGLRFAFDAQPGERVILGSLDLYPLVELGSDRELRLARSLDGHQLRVTDGEGLGWDVGGGRFTINCSDPELCDCLDFSAGGCELSATSIDFGNVNYGHLATRDLAITNVGYATLAGDLAISGDYFFLIEGEGPFLLEPGQVHEAVVGFQPGGVGIYEGLITTGLADCPEIPCHGTGTGGGGGSPLMGIFADELGLICELDQVPYLPASVYVLAILPAWLPSITAAEFGIENLPENDGGGIRTDNWNTILLIGTPGYGIALAFSPALPGPVAVLGTLDFLEINDDWISVDHRMEVRESLESGSLVVVGPDFVEYWCEPGLFTFNCTGNLPDGCGCGYATPVALADFRLEDLGGAARLQWSTLDGWTPEFRLEGERDGLRWLVPYQETAPGHFRAEDHAAALGSAGSVSYRLLGRLPGENWQLLREATLQVAGKPLRTALLAAHPNPFNPQVTLPFSLGTAGPVRLSIYDVAGRRVAILVDGERAAGQHAEIWQGRDEDGRPVSTGVYFVSLEARGHSETQKLVLIR